MRNLWKILLSILFGTLALALGGVLSEIFTGGLRGEVSREKANSLSLVIGLAQVVLLVIAVRLPFWIWKAKKE